MTPEITFTAIGERRHEAIDWLRGFVDQLAAEGLDPHRVEIARFNLDRLDDMRRKG